VTGEEDGVFNPLTDIGAKIDRTLKAMIFAAAAGAAGTVAIFLFSIGGFVWMRENYGTANACIALGAAYALVALVALTSLLVLQRKQAKRAAARHKASAQWWQDPAMLATGVQIMRMVGIRKLVPLAIAGVLAGIALGMPSSSSAASARTEPRRPEERPKPNGKGTFTQPVS
jgi:hypothetical protein